MKIYLPLFALLASSPIYAAIQNPPLFKNLSGESNTVEIDLNVKYKEGKLYNPNSNQFDRVKLRQYIDPKHPLTDQFISPTMRVKPGQKLKVNLANKLPLDSTCSDKRGLNDPHCFNYTNLHTHGLWIDPGENKNNTSSDNVFIKVAPGTTHQYEFIIPETHPAGTYWYHAHLHGSTALQVSSGMAGALIIEGDRKPTPSKNGDIDVILKDMPEQIFVFQQIQYGCNPNTKRTSGHAVNCSNQQVGQVYDYTDLKDPSAWKKSKLHTSVNGKVFDNIIVEKNQIYRWRMIHGGVRDTLGLVIKELPNSSLLTNDIAKYQCQNLGKFNKIDSQYASKVKEFNHKKNILFNIFAQDGLTMNSIQSNELAILHPGYRQDSLVSFNSVNKYCIFDTNLPKNSQINTNNSSSDIKNDYYANLIAVVDVKASTKAPINVHSHLATKAKALSLDNFIINNIKNNNLENFTPHKTLKNEKKIGRQELTFSIRDEELNDLKKEPNNLFAISDQKNSFKSAIPYGKNQTTRLLKLNSVDEWVLTSRAQLKSTTKDSNGNYPLQELSIGHPFHIHVNPFEIQSITRDGVDITNPKDVKQAVAEKNFKLDSTDKQLMNLKGVWKDTLFIPAKYEVVVRTKYEKFTGDFVLHCHILDHEDLGMMQNVRICNDPTSAECKKPFSSSHSSH